MSNDADQEMFQLLSEWVKPHELDNQSDNYHRNALWDRILTVFDSGYATEFGVLQTLSSLFQNADRPGKLSLIITMDDLVYISTSRGGYGYPELFWLVLESNLLFEYTDISDVGSRIAGFLCRTGGIQATRTYLIHILLSDDKTKHTNAFLAFYATGHSLQSLRITMEVAPEPTDSNTQLYVFIYSDAWAFLARNNDVKLSAEDKADLTAFFNRGLALTNSFAIDYCQKALEILGKTSE
ncbi:MAG: hypothetical protein ABI947_23305 [Chloroflexota bacterium]